MNELKLESLTAEQKKQLCDQALPQAEARCVDAKLNYLAALASLEAIRNERNALLASIVKAEE